MLVYRIRQPSTGLYLLSVGNTGHGRWHSRGKLYMRAEDARGAIAQLERRLKFVTEYQEKVTIGWSNLTEVHKPRIAEAASAATQKALDDLEVVEYNLEVGKVLDTKEFRNGKTSPKVS